MAGRCGYRRGGYGIETSVAKLLFIPFSIAGGLLAGLVGKKLFDGVWGLIDDEEAPDGSQREVPWWKLLLAAAVEGAIFRAVKAATERGSRQAFESVTGNWPGEEQPDSA
jgi:Protein of unknown function (DUF4235)